MKNTLFVAVQQSQRKACGDASMRDPSRTLAGWPPLSLKPWIHNSLHPCSLSVLPRLSRTSSLPSSERKPIYTKYTLRLLLLFFFAPLAPTFDQLPLWRTFNLWVVGRSGTKRDGGGETVSPTQGERCWTDFLWNCLVINPTLPRVL